MKKQIAVVVATIVSVLVLSSADTKAQEGDKIILKKVEELRLAMLNPTEKQLDALSSEKLNYWHSSGKRESKQEFMQTLLSGQSDFVTLSFDNVQVSMGNKVATVQHILQGDTNDNNKPGKVRIGVLLVFNQEGKEWKLFARQAYKLP